MENEKTLQKRGGRYLYQLFFSLCCGGNKIYKLQIVNYINFITSFYKNNIFYIFLRLNPAGGGVVVVIVRHTIIQIALLIFAFVR